jgi:hypothetical protein
VKLCIIDMNNGLTNQAIRSFRRILTNFIERARSANPGLEAEIVHVQPRNLGEEVPHDCDLYLSTGGPDGPIEAMSQPWFPGYQAFLDEVVLDEERSAFLVCYSFELAICHFKIAEMEPRTKKFGIMPVYPTPEGTRRPMLAPFGDRFFAWEHRTWQAVNLDESILSALGGELLALESRDGISKGPGLMAFEFSPSLEGTIFHPEADRPGVLDWLERPDEKQKVIDAYGETTYHRMRKTIDDPMRLARTYALLLPGWLARGFNNLAARRGWNPLAAPTYDGTALGDFER